MIHWRELQKEIPLNWIQKKNEVEPNEIVNLEQTNEPTINESVEDVVEDTTTTETTYFVDDEEVKNEEITNQEEQPKIKRLSYSK